MNYFSCALVVFIKLAGILDALDCIEGEISLIFASKAELKVTRESLDRLPTFHDAGICSFSSNSYEMDEKTAFLDEQELLFLINFTDHSEIDLNEGPLNDELFLLFYSFYDTFNHRIFNLLQAAEFLQCEFAEKALVKFIAHDLINFDRINNESYSLKELMKNLNLSFNDLI